MDQFRPSILVLERIILLFRSCCLGLLLVGQSLAQTDTVYEPVHGFIPWVSIQATGYGVSLASGVGLEGYDGSMWGIGVKYIPRVFLNTELPISFGSITPTSWEQRLGMVGYFLKPLQALSHKVSVGFLVMYSHTGGGRRKWNTVELLPGLSWRVGKGRIQSDFRAFLGFATEFGEDGLMPVSTYRFDVTPNFGVQALINFYPKD